MRAAAARLGRRLRTAAARLGRRLGAAALLGVAAVPVRRKVSIHDILLQSFG